MRVSRWIPAALLMGTTGAFAQVPKFHTTLDDTASITVTNGTEQGSAPSYVAGAIGNAFQSTGTSYARWTDARVGTIFSGWNNSSGVTVDLYFRGDHWSTHTGDSGLWSIVRRSSDAFIIVSVRAGKLRLLFNNNTGNTTQWKYTFDGGLTPGEIAPDLPLADNTTYRLTMRQLNGAFELYLNGGAYSNAAPVFTASNLPAGYTWNMVPSGGSPAREMNVGNRGAFGGTLQAGEWVDNVRVFNGYFSPANIDAGGSPTSVINADVTAGFVPLTVNFSGTGSFDAGIGTIVSYGWDFDNNGTIDDSSGPTVQHIYNSAGEYVCRLRVTDNDGNTADSTQPVSVYSLPANGLVPIISMLPSGTLAAGSHPLTSVTCKRPESATSYTATNLAGPPDVNHVVVTGGAITGSGAGATTPQEAMVGLELGSLVAGLNANGKFLDGYFPSNTLVQPDGTPAPEIFFVEMSTTTDNFQIQLLTNPVGSPEVVAATLQVRTVDYASTSTVIGGTPRGGVGIDLDILGVSNVRGVRITGADGLGGGSGVDPVLIAGIGQQCNSPFADFDDDGDVDMNDFAVVQRCYTGSTPAPGAYDPAACFCADRDGNSAIDEFDFNAFRDCATRSDVPFDSQNPPPGCNP